MGKQGPRWWKGPVPPDPDPDRWPVAVASGIRMIAELLRQRIPLQPGHCRYLADYFVLPNVVHWVLEMANRTSARPFRQECPIYRGEPDCAGGHVATASCVQSAHRDDFCRCREEDHPWSLQVTLVFNDYPGWRAAGLRPGGPPSVSCAKEVWRRIGDNSIVRDRWRFVRFDARHRERVLLPVWQQIMRALGDVASQVLDPSVDLAGMACAKIGSRVLRVYCRRAARLLDHWVRVQRGGGKQAREELRARINEVVAGLMKGMLVFFYRQWPFPTGRYRGQVKAFLDLVESLDLEGKARIRDLFGRDALGFEEQKEVVEYVVRRVFVERDRELPPGDPLDDPLVQELFWHRVGGTPAGRGRGFSVHDWAWHRWKPVDSGAGTVPLWRTTP